MQCLILMEAPLIMRVVSQRRWSLRTDFKLTKLKQCLNVKPIQIR